MRYKELMKDYHSKGMVSEKKMWEAICELDEAMECLKEKDPDTYDEAIRDIHEVFCGPHYNEHFAKMDVAAMRHKGKSGEDKGEHWNIQQVTAVAKGASRATPIFGTCMSLLTLTGMTRRSSSRNGLAPRQRRRSLMTLLIFISWMMTLRKARCGSICVPWMTKRLKNKGHVKKKESARREIDRLTDSLDFEPVNFYEVMARIRHLMCLL